MLAPLSASILALAFVAVGGAQAQHTRTFKGYVCTKDCSGHIAGYRWAQRKGIKDPSECGGNSQSFYEGCLAYANGR